MDGTDHVLATTWAADSSFPSLKVSRVAGCNLLAGPPRGFPPYLPTRLTVPSPPPLQSLVVFPGNKGVCHPDKLAPKSGHYDVMDTFFTRYNGVVVSGPRERERKVPWYPLVPVIAAATASLPAFLLSAMPPGRQLKTALPVLACLPAYRFPATRSELTRLPRAEHGGQLSHQHSTTSHGLRMQHDSLP
jgi:hypothetical protein